MKCIGQQVQKNAKHFFAPASRGFSFIEVIVSVAIFALVFGGLFGAFQLMATLLGKAKAQAGATALMTERMEYIRSLPYNSIGTDGGVPSGAIPQTSTTTLNGVTYNERVLIQYIDDPADGIGSADSNGILADYKQIKVEYRWSLRNKSYTVSLVSNIVPPGIESTTGGGTIKVNVFDASVTPVAGASVRFVNASTSPAIDTIRYTDLTGVVFLSGAPAASGYEITVTDTGFSTDGTYTASSTNPNPTTPPVSVLESQVSTMNFQIDKVSDLTIQTVLPPTYASFTDTFSDSSLIATTSSTTVSGGTVQLIQTLGVYDNTGFVQATTTEPTSISAWYALEFSASTSASTTVRVSLMYDNAGTMTLVPDSVLAGNSIGFTTSPIDISGVDVATYPALALYSTLDTTDTAYTPVLHDWTLTYITIQTPVSGVGLSLQGSKSIGTDASSQPVLKYTASGVSDSNGIWEQSNIEWDVYTVEVTSAGYNVQEICPYSPYSLEPDTAKTMKVTLGSATAQFLRVYTTQTDGTPIPNATVLLENTGISQTNVTSLCGQTYFNSGLYADADYTVTVSAPGYTTSVTTGVTVNATSTLTVILN